MRTRAFKVMVMIGLLATQAGRSSADPFFQILQDPNGELLLYNYGNPDPGNPNLEVVGLQFHAASAKLRLENYRTLKKLTEKQFDVLIANDHWLAEATLGAGKNLDPNEKGDYIRMGRLVPIPDFTLDGVVNLGDLGRLKANFGTGSTLQEGDNNGDHQVDLSDFGDLRTWFGADLNELLVIKVLIPPAEPMGSSPAYTARVIPTLEPGLGATTPPDGVARTEPAAAPEPAAIVLALLGALGLVWLTARRQL